MVTVSNVRNVRNENVWNIRYQWTLKHVILSQTATSHSYRIRDDSVSAAVSHCITLAHLHILITWHCCQPLAFSCHCVCSSQHNYVILIFTMWCFSLSICLKKICPHCTIPCTWSTYFDLMSVQTTGLCILLTFYWDDWNFLRY